MTFQCPSFEYAVMENEEDEVVDAMGGGGEGQKLERWKIGKD